MSETFEVIPESGSTEKIEIPVEVKLVDEPKKELKPEPVNAIAVDAVTKQLIVRDNRELARMVKTFMQGKAFPASFDNDAKCIAAWNLACSLLPRAPQRAVSRMMIVNGVIGIWGELPKALAEETKELEDFELYVVDKEYNIISLANKNLHAEVYAGVCRIKRKGRTKNEYFFTMDEADKAGLLDKKGPWTQGYAKQMLCWRAQGHGLKMEFADALMGAEIIEYRFNKFPELKDVTPERDNAAEINKIMEAAT